MSADAVILKARADAVILKARTRAVCGDRETADAADTLIRAAAKELPALLEAMIPDALSAAGLPPEAAVAIRSLDVRLRVRADASPGEIARAWARATATALAAELPRLREQGEPDDDSDADIAYPDSWAAELAVLRAVASGAQLPWWAVASDPAAIVEGWIRRDPARAAIMLVDLLADETMAALFARLRPRRLAEQLHERLRLRLIELGMPVPSVPRAQPALRDALARLPAALRLRARTLPPDTQPLFLLAALLAARPDSASTIAAFTSDALAAPVGAGDAPREPQPDPTSADADARPLVEIFGGGLLLLLHPLLERLPDAERRRDLLLAVALATLQRCTAPLGATARRLALERDRPLLGLFGEVPDGPLDALPVSESAARWLDRLIEDLPEAEWAPSAIRRVYGGIEPFGDDPPTARLARLVMRPGLLARTPWSAELIWPLDAADIAIRRAGWDIDPGWLPWIGRTIAFRYGEPA